MEIVQADLDDKESLVRAFEGAAAIFSNADFFAHLFQGPKPDDPPAGRTPLEYARDREVAQGMNIAEAAESPSVLSTLEHFVLSSLSDAIKWSGGKYKTVYHFNSKATIVRLTQERCPGVASKMSTVILGHYVTQWKSVRALAPKKQSDGSFVLSRNTPSDFKMPLVVPQKDTGSFVKALIEMPPQKNILAVSEYMTFPEYMEVWGRVHGVKTRYEEISRQDLFSGIPEPVATEIADSHDFVHDFGYAGGDPSVLEPKQVRVKATITAPVSHREWYIDVINRSISRSQ